MFGLGQWEILIILLVILLVFGAKRIPDMAQGLGRGIREFRKAVHEVQDEVQAARPEPAPRTMSQAPPPDQVARQAGAPLSPAAAAPPAAEAAEESPQG
ncbi:MAG: twin-arginine translocase TatA/TatE family subunit [Gemmatimonadota bacterium]